MLNNYYANKALVKLDDIKNEFDLEIIYKSKNYNKTFIETYDVNRPGLQLTGFFDYFDNKRIQIIGKVETTFLKHFDSSKRITMFNRFFKTNIPAVIIAHENEIFNECILAAKKYDITLFKSHECTSSLLSAVVLSLKTALSPMIVLHGVLLEIYGEGVLILGDSGIGKSEIAIELIKRGHKLISDDAVKINKISDKLIGCAPDIIKHFIELRGIGIVDIYKIFGIKSIKNSEKIDLIIKLENWIEKKYYDRLGNKTLYTEILGLNIPSLTIPVKPGRNLAVIIEVATMNNKNKKIGHNAANELIERFNKNN